MKRRKFIKTASASAAGILGMPYILPTGRMYAQGNPRLANHVILVMFAGGVRQQDAVLKQYLDGSQNEFPSQYARSCGPFCLPRVMECCNKLHASGPHPKSSDPMLQSDTPRT